MLGKFILTLLVMVIAFLVLRQRSLSPQSDQPKQHQNTESTGNDPVDSTDPTSDFRLAAYLFLILMFGAAIIIYYQRWQDDHTILTVSLFRSDQSAANTYQVYKYQLDSRTFTTIDGILITVADSERMEVQGLE